MGVAAQAASLVPLGQAVGIQMTTAGVLVADLAEVDTPGGTCTPAKDAGLRPGDVICRMDGREIVSSADFLAALDAAGDTVSVTVRRGGAEITAAVTPAVMPDGTRQLGLWLRDGVTGVGTLDAPPDGTPVETAPASAVRTGSATILSTVAGDTVQAYTVNITRVYHDGASTRFAITVTDPALLAATGGIVQGMSGSPILQDGRLIGAVTHVLLSDPAKGYGVSIDDMLAAAQAQAA